MRLMFPFPQARFLLSQLGQIETLKTTRFETFVSDYRRSFFLFLSFTGGRDLFLEPAADGGTDSAFLMGGYNRTLWFFLGYGSETI